MANNESTNTGKEGKSVVGEWQLACVTEDKNGHKHLNTVERANAKKYWDDQMKLNCDGSAFYTVAKLEGRSELKPKYMAGKTT